MGSPIRAVLRDKVNIRIWNKKFSCGQEYMLINEEEVWSDERKQKEEKRVG